MISVLGHMTPVAVKEEGSRRKRESSFPDRLLKLMREMFGVENVNWSREEEEKIEIIVDSNLAVLNTGTLVRNREGYYGMLWDNDLSLSLSLRLLSAVMILSIILYLQLLRDYKPHFHVRQHSLLANVIIVLFQ